MTFLRQNTQMHPQIHSPKHSLMKTVKQGKIGSNSRRICLQSAAGLHALQKIKHVSVMIIFCKEPARATIECCCLHTLENTKNVSVNRGIICNCAFVYVCVRLSAFVRECVWTHVYTYITTYLYLCVYAYVYVHIHICMCMCICICICICICVYICICICVIWTYQFISNLCSVACLLGKVAAERVQVR